MDVSFSLAMLEEETNEVKYVAAMADNCKFRSLDYLCMAGTPILPADPVHC